MHEHARRDHELATFTNQLLAGEEPEEMDELAELATVVRQLHAAIAPHEKPSPTFQKRLRQRLELEWNLQQRQQRPTRWWAHTRARQLAALAAGLAVLVAAAVWLSWQQEGESGALKGTAVGATAGTLVAFGVVALVGLGLWALYRRRR